MSIIFIFLFVGRVHIFFSFNLYSYVLLYSSLSLHQSLCLVGLWCFIPAFILSYFLLWVFSVLFSPFINLINIIRQSISFCPLSAHFFYLFFSIYLRQGFSFWNLHFVVSGLCSVGSEVSLDIVIVNNLSTNFTSSLYYYRKIIVSPELLYYFILQLCWFMIFFIFRFIKLILILLYFSYHNSYYFWVVSTEQQSSLLFSWFRIPSFSFCPIH